MTTIADMLAQAKTHHQAGRFPAAAALYRQLLAADPTQVEARYLLGAACHAMGQISEAMANLDEALRQRPDLAEVHHHLGIVLAESRRPDEAERCFRRALQLQPQLIDVHHDLGVLMASQGRLGEALESFRHVVELKPHDAIAHSDLGAAMERQGELDAAAECFQRAIEIDPANAQLHNDLGSILTRQGRLPEAIDCLRQAIRLKPNHADAHFNLAISLLLTGRLPEGWPELEWRFQRQGRQLPEVSQPRWRGENLAGGTILLRCEQGLGDTLQFIRYVECIAQRGGQAIVEVQRPLVPILEQSGFRNVIARGSPQPAFDVHAPLMSLPGLFGTTLTSIPNRVPYLVAEPRLVERWRATLGRGKLKVGIAWQGNPRHEADRFRSIPLAEFAPLASAGVELISLQKGAGLEQLAGLGGKLPVREMEDPIDELHGAFMDTAAIIANLDVVVTCDTSIAHLAGALGARVWLVLSSAPDWRWLLERPDTPWYPTMRLFRQGQLGRWDDVFERIRNELIGLQ